MKSREFWIICRGPGFLVVVWFGSTFDPSPILPSVSWTGDTQENWEREMKCTVKLWNALVAHFFIQSKYSKLHFFNSVDMNRQRSAWQIVSAQCPSVNNHLANTTPTFKGTQEWEFFWLRFWILYYFIVSYVKILRFCKKKLFDLASIGGGTIFPRSPRTTRNEKNFWGRSKKYF